MKQLRILSISRFGFDILHHMGLDRSRVRDEAVEVGSCLLNLDLDVLLL